MNRWYRSKEIGSGIRDDPYRPKGADKADGFSGNKAMDKAPIWLVRFYGDEATLDEIANMPAVQELSDIPDQALNNMLGQNRSKEKWNRGFRVGE